MAKFRAYFETDTRNCKIEDETVEGLIGQLNRVSKTGVSSFVVDPVPKNSKKPSKPKKKVLLKFPPKNDPEEIRGNGYKNTHPRFAIP
jgi:hypothetical protein